MNHRLKMVKASKEFGKNQMFQTVQEANGKSSLYKGIMMHFMIFLTLMISIAISKHRDSTQLKTYSLNK